MHLNVHVAVGIIIASITTLFISLNFWTFGCIVLCAFITDFDILIRNRAKDGNHRNLFTHSIYPAMIIVGVGLILRQPWLMIAGVVYLVHLLMDTFDWGVNLFYTGRTVGSQLLIHPEEKENFQQLLNQLPIKSYFFAHRYYTTRWVQISESFCFLGMIALMIWLTPSFWYFGWIYVLTLSLHLVEYQELKNRINGKNKRI